MSTTWVRTAAGELREAMTRMVENRRTPGGVAAIGSPGEREFVSIGTTTVDGNHTVGPGTFYDIASLTKIAATWPLIGSSVAAGTVDLDAPLSKYIAHDPAPRPYPGAEVTFRQILTHTSGLMAATRLDRYVGDERDIVEAILAEPLEEQGRHRYINRGFILAGLLLERMHGTGLATMLTEYMDSLGVRGLRYGPMEPSGHVAATERRLAGANPVHGTVHDENAASLGGVAGHAGVFATAEGLSLYAEALLRAASKERQAYVRESWRPSVRVDEDTYRGLGWLVNPASGLVYHHGFTGTSLFLHPATGRHLVLLTNAIAYGRRRHGLSEVREIAMGAFS